MAHIQHAEVIDASHSNFYDIAGDQHNYYTGKHDLENPEQIHELIDDLRISRFW
jgi:hypothetical protein